MAVLRSIENRRYLLRATSDGVSAVVDPTGRIVHRSPLHQEDRFLASFQFLQNKTMFTHWGYLFPYFCLLLVLLDGLRAIAKKLNKRFHQPRKL